MSVTDGRGCPARIIVVDDHPLVHQGLGAIIGTCDDLELTGGALSLGDGLRLLKDGADVALVDVQLGTESGLDFVAEGRQVAPECRFVILSSGYDAATVRAALGLGVAGYVLKDAPPAQLLQAIRLAALGRRYVDAAALERLLDDPSRMQMEHLTERQVEVLAALGRGLGTLEIAAELHIAESTVKKHISEILAKLGLADRTQAALYAVVHGLVHVDEIKFAISHSL